MSLAMLMQDLVPAVAPPVAPSATRYILSLSEVFLMFFIMLGPIKAIGPYFVAAQGLDTRALQRQAFKVFALSAIAVLLAGLVGSSLMQKWLITTTMMELCGGLIFLIAALQTVLSQYRPAVPPAPATTPGQPGAAFVHLVFPVTVPPYGVAAIITLMALSTDSHRYFLVLALALLVMVLNLLTMLAIRHIMRWVGMMPLQILGAVLGVLQVALALQMLTSSLQGLR